MAGGGMLYELRVYTSLPGKLPALLERFEKVNLPIWVRLGIRPVGFWTVMIGGPNQELHYMLAWESLAEREHKWHDFHSDPEWLAKRAESERDGPLVAVIRNSILAPTRFSELK
jgi:hypothetical protein